MSTSTGSPYTLHTPACCAQTGVEMTYIGRAGEPNGDGGDQYTGQDRFNRITDIRWLHTDTGAQEERVKYTFDRASNRTARNNLVGGTPWNEAYTYDGLYQLATRRRGTNIEEEEFTYDPTGNWLRYVTKANGAVTLDQSRTHNRANEITGITATSGSTSPLGYDRDGNMTLMPKVGDWATGQTPTWDAWNRTVKITQGAATVGTYAYDGLTRRVWKESVESGSAVTRRHFYYSDQWQVLEERKGLSAGVDRSYVWGLRYADDLIARDSVVSGAARLYAVHDQWNVTATLSTLGAATERYAFSAFGNTQVLAPDFTPRVTGSISGWETTYGAYRFDRESSLYAVRYRNLHSPLGRWVSRDPIGSVAGVNLCAYGSNAPSNVVDSSGLRNLTEQECEQWIAIFTADARVQALKRELNSMRCNPQISCECCQNTATDSSYGYYDPRTRNITVCYDVPQGSANQILFTLRHELIHARNDCQGWGDDSCASVICDELDAYANSGECDGYTGELYYECVVQGAVTSTQKQPACRWRNRRRLAERLFVNCTGNAP